MNAYFSYLFGLILVLALNLLQLWPLAKLAFSLSDTNKPRYGDLNPGCLHRCLNCRRIARRAMVSRHWRRRKLDEIPRKDLPHRFFLSPSVPAGRERGWRMPQHPASAGGSAPPSVPAAPGWKGGATPRKFSQIANVPVRILRLGAMLHDNKVRRQRLPEQLLPKPEIPGIENHLSIHSQMYIRAIYQAAALQLPLHQACFLSPGWTIRASSSLCVTQNGWFD